MEKLIPLLLGAIFGLGICLADLGNPNKLINGFARFERWDPSVYFTLLSVFSLLFLSHKVFGSQAPFKLFQKEMDVWLFCSIILSGIGFVLSGFLPATAVAGTVSLELENFAFLLAFLFGGLIAKPILGDHKAL